MQLPKGKIAAVLLGFTLIAASVLIRDLSTTTMVVTCLAGCAILMGGIISLLNNL